MVSFDVVPLPRIVFGAGKVAQLRELSASLGLRPLLIHNTRNADLISRIESLALPVAVFHQRGEPKTTDVDAAVSTARGSRCDCIVALGGGSAIDLAKITAGLLANSGEALDYMEVVGKGQKITRPAAPWIALPTTAGTGAEVTRNAVIGYFPSSPNGQTRASPPLPTDAARTGQVFEAASAPMEAPTDHPAAPVSPSATPFKASIRSEHLLPRCVLIDPQLQLHVRPEVTAASGLDALCQCIEAYTSTGASPVTDLFAAEGIRLASNALPAAFEDGRSLDARRDMALAALYSGIALTNAGLGAVHGFAAPLGAMFAIPHGVICGLLLPHVVRANIRHLLCAAGGDHPAVRRYGWIAQIVCADSTSRDPLETLPVALISLVQRLRLPRLGQFDVTSAHIPTIVAQAQRASSMKYNPVSLSEDALADVLSAAL